MTSPATSTRSVPPPGRASSDDASASLRDATLQQIAHLPVNPGPLVSVLRASPGDPDAVAEALGRCPTLTARLLSVTNSAAFGVRRPIDNVRRAVLHLGAERARSMALAFGLRGLHEGLGLDEPWLSQLWISSLRKGCAAQLACREVDPAVETTAFCRGLIQDVGLTLLVALDPAHYEQTIVPAGQARWCELERERFGVDHVEVGVHLLRSWDAGDEVAEGVARHHEPPQLPDEPDAAARAQPGMLIALYLTSLVPHLNEAPSAGQVEWLTSLHATFLAPTYPTPDAFFTAAAELAAPLHADREDALTQRQTIATEVARAICDDTVGMVRQIARLEGAVGRQREDLDNLRFQAFTDPLTKLLNRRGFTSLAAQRLELAGRHGLKACLMAMDLDDFKPINDRFGHEAGDRMLREFARLLRTSLDRNDLIGRLGGDEFVVLLCGVDEPKARAIAERVTQTCIDKPLQVAEGESGKVTLRFSVGAIFVDSVEPNVDLHDLLNAADGAMYRQKREGKGGLQFSQLPAEPENHRFREAQ